MDYGSFGGHSDDQFEVLPRVVVLASLHALRPERERDIRNREIVKSCNREIVI
jgi:hypothetical protein